MKHALEELQLNNSNLTRIVTTISSRVMELENQKHDCTKLLFDLKQNTISNIEKIQNSKTRANISFLTNLRGDMDAENVLISRDLGKDQKSLETIITDNRNRIGKVIFLC